jgi:hypothetical protein
MVRSQERRFVWFHFGTAMAWIASTSFLRTAIRTPLSSSSSLSCRHIFTRSSPARIPKTNPFACRALHASTPRHLRISPVSRVRDYYSNGGRGPSGRTGVIGGFWALVDRIPGNALVYAIIALDVGIWWVYQISQGVSRRL